MSGALSTFFATLLQEPMDGRKPQIDALRAFAVFLVIWAHTMRPTLPVERDFGAVGVMLFFVLSGFLITGILANAGDDARIRGIARHVVLGRFYARRFLRIFPLYYAVIAVMWLAGIQVVRDTIWWLVSYQMNNLMAISGRTYQSVSVFWSLAVEEQFYMLWPLVVLLAPRSKLKPILAVMVVSASIWRVVGSHYGFRGNAVILPLWACWDGLALGAWLALMPAETRATFARKTWLVALGLLTVRTCLEIVELQPAARAGIYMLPWALISMCLIDAADRSALPRLFNSKAVVGMGAVSYGVYVYHRPLSQYVLAPLMQSAGHPVRPGVPLLIAVTAMTIVVAYASWRLFEQPINDLKRFVPYVPRPKSPDQSQLRAVHPR